MQVFRAQINKNHNCEVGQRLHSISKRSDFGFVVVTHPPFSAHIYIYIHMHTHTHRYIYIYSIYIYAPGPATPPWDGSHILAPYEIFLLPPCGVVGVWHCPPPPPVVRWGCGMVCWVCMVCMVGLVWHVWKVWYVWYVW